MKVIIAVIVAVLITVTSAVALSIIAGPFEQEELIPAAHDPVFYNELGFKLAQEGRTADAQRAFAKAVELRPTYETARSNLATIAFQNGDYTTAIAQLRVLVTSHPENKNYHFDLAQNLASQARYDDGDIEKLQEAASEFDKAGDLPHAAENAAIVRTIVAEYS
jgi:Flp pilus assembly protein TadD